MTQRSTEAELLLRQHGPAGGVIDVTAAPGAANDASSIGAEVLREVLAAPTAPGAPPLTLVGARVVGDLDLTGATIARGITFRDCRFDRIVLDDAETRTLRFEGGGCRGLTARRTHVKGTLGLGKGFEARGEVGFVESRIEGSVDLRGGKFWSESGEDASPTAVNFERAHIDQAMVLGAKFAAWGNVRLYRASIGANLEITDAEILGRQPEGSRPASSLVGHWGLDLEGASVGGAILIGKGASVTEGLNLYAATVGSLEVLEGGAVHAHTPSGVALQGDYATFEHTLDLWPRALLIGGVELRQASTAVLTLRDYLTWPTGGVVLDGFTYERFATSGQFIETDPVEWLRRQSARQLEPFRPQPWEQCAKALGAMGDDDGARRVQIEKERAWRGVRRHRRPAWQRAVLMAYDAVLDGTIRFGYRPARAGLWLAVFLLLGWAVFARVGTLVPGAPPETVALVPGSEHPPAFQPLVFAVDSFVPVLGLGMADAWRPSDAPQAWWLRWFVWVYKLFGWALAGFWIAGFTGLVKK